MLGGGGFGVVAVVIAGVTSAANIPVDRRENVDEYSGQRQGDQERNAHNGGRGHTREHSQLQLDHIHHRHQQEQAPNHRRHRGEEDSGRQQGFVDGGGGGLIGGVGLEVEGELDGLSDEGGEEEEAEGEDLEDDQHLRGVGSRLALFPDVEALQLPRRRHRQPQENGDGEE